LRLIPGWREMGQLIRATIAERVRIAIPCERTAADHNRGYLLIHCIFNAAQHRRPWPMANRRGYEPHLSAWRPE
jgi:hypothetical protein